MSERDLSKGICQKQKQLLSASKQAMNSRSTLPLFGIVNVSLQTTEYPLSPQLYEDDENDQGSQHSVHFLDHFHFHVISPKKQLPVAIAHAR